MHLLGPKHRAALAVKLFLTVPNWEQSKYPSAGKWINQPWFSYFVNDKFLKIKAYYLSTTPWQKLLKRTIRGKNQALTPKVNRAKCLPFTPGHKFSPEPSSWAVPDRDPWHLGTRPASSWPKPCVQPHVHKHHRLKCLIPNENHSHKNTKCLWITWSPQKAQHHQAEREREGRKYF